MPHIPVGRNEKGVALSDHELAKRAAPGGRLPMPPSTTKPDPRGEPRHTPIGDASPAAFAAAQERHETRVKADLVAKRQREGR
jgi:hypothetical protein